MSQKRRILAHSGGTSFEYNNSLSKKNENWLKNVRIGIFALQAVHFEWPVQNSGINK
jgi:hypothetical protein